MSHSHEVQGSPAGSLPGGSMHTLTEAPNGGLHLLVVFEVPATDEQPDGADPSGAESVESVLSGGASTAAFTETEFGETVDVESLVSYLGLDFVEHELFADQFPDDDDDVVYTSRGVGTYQLLCVYSADLGLLLVVDEDEAIRPLVDRVRTLLAEV